MRLRRLDLQQFGHFTDHTIDFGPRPDTGSDFHIIFGRNEAGKTTAMEGYLRLLYGFGARDPYAFKHQRPNLRVGGVLEIDGVEHALTRLPTRGGNLVDSNGQAVPDLILNQALKGLSQKEYQKLLCLDDETIEAGGEEITKSQGDIGRLLFSAAAGISDLSQVLEDVQARTRDIYLKGGSKSEFAALKSEHDKITKDIRDHDVSASAYRGLRVALDQANTTEATLRAQKKDLSLRLVQLDNILKAHPLAAEWQDLQAQLEPIAHYPETMDLDSEQLIGLMTSRIALVAKRDQAAQAIADLTTQRAAIHIDDDALNVAARIEALGPLKGRVEAAQHDLPKRETELQQEQAEMRARLTTIGITASDVLERFVLTDVQLAELDRAQGALNDARKHLTVARREATDAQDKQRDAARLAKDAADQVQGDPALERTIAKADADDLVQQYRAAQIEIAAAEKASAALVLSLARQGITFDGAPVLSISAAGARDLDAELAQAKLAVKNASQAAGVASTRWQAAQTELELTQALPDLVSDETAAETRKTRDALWATHRTTLDSDTADAFEVALRSDDAQTRLRAGQSKELAEARQAWRQELVARKEHAAALEVQAQEQAHLDRLQDQLVKHLRAAGLPDTLTADDFAGWVRDVEDARTAQDTYNRAEADWAKTLDQAERLRHDLAAALNEDDAPLTALVKIAKDQIAVRQAQQNAAHLTASALRAAASEASRRDEIAAGAAQHLGATLVDWRAVVAAHLPDLQADIDTWNGLNALRSIREIDARSRAIARQIRGIRQDSDTFANHLDVLGLGGADTLPPLDRYAQAHARVIGAQQHDQNIKDLDARLAELTATGQDAEKALQVLDDQVRVLAAVFDARVPTETLADLRAATAVADTAISLRARAREVMVSLLGHLDVNRWEDAQTILRDLPQDQASVDLAAVQDDLNRLDSALEAAIAARARAQLDLEAVGGDSDIALRVAQKRTVEEQMQAALLRYLQGRFGHSLAEEAIRRYRDSHRSGMLAATETAFSDLTQGAYTKLITQPGPGGEVLLAVQTSDGAAKEASAMSKGTRFQLYLALRAAAYDQMAKNGTVLPFFCDDVFETFDEDRTRAACHLMQRVGQTGQAIYLTHHQHVVDLAHAACGDQVKVHQL